MPASRIIDIELTVPPRPAAGRPVEAPSRPGPIQAEPDARLGDLVDAVLHQCHAHWLANRRAARSIEDPEGIHQLRVATRRTRSALTLFSDLLARQPARELRRELRWLGRALASARDWDVFCLETLAEVRSALPDAPGLRRLCWEAELQRLTAHGNARDALDSDRFAYLALRLDRTVRGGAWRDGLGRKATKRLGKGARKSAAKLLDDAFAEVRLLDGPIGQLAPEQLHALRIRTKRLRYATEFLAPVHPGRARRRFAKRLRALQEVLGRMNDGRVADALLDDLLDDALLQVEAPVREPLARAAGLVSGWTHRRVVTEHGDIEKAWLAVARTSPFWR